MLQSSKAVGKGDPSAIGMIRRWASGIALAAAVSMAYFLAAQLSLRLLMQPDGVAVFWLSGGITSGVLIALGPRARWPVAAGAVAGDLVPSLLSGWAAVAVGLCNAAEALIAAGLIQYYFGTSFTLSRLRPVVGFLVAAVVATAISGIGGAIVYKLSSSPTAPILTTWWHWFASDALGIISLAPLVIGVAAAMREPPPRNELIEGGAALALLAGMTGVIISLPHQPWESVVPNALLFPMLLWLAARCRPVFAAAGAFMVAFTVVWTTIFGIGHFGDPGLPIVDRILEAQAVIMVVTVGSFVLAALFAERRRQEAVLLESETRLQEALATGGVMAFEWDAATDTVRRSNNAAQVLGLDPQQSLSGASLIARVHPDDLARVRALRSSLNRDNPTRSITFRFLCFDGREVWLQERSKAEFDAAGRLLRLRGLTRDITERKQANMRIAADLEAMKRLHRVGIECARSENEMNYCLEEIVEAAIAITGANKGNVQLFDPTSGGLTIAAQRGFEEPFLKYFARLDDTTACGIAAQTHERMVVEDVAHGISIEKPSLSVLLDAGVRAVVSEPLISSSGKLLGVLAIHFSLPHRPGERELQLLDLLARQAADFLERRAAVEQLRDSEERMRAIVNTAQNGIITIDDKGTIENLNPAAARMFGYRAQDVVGRNVTLLMPERYHQQHDTGLKNYLKTGQSKVIGIERELTGLRKNGSTFPMEVTVSEITVAGRRMFVGVLHNITNRMRSAERQATLIAELDHRVKNVLARVAMLAATTRKGSTSIENYVSTLQGRVQSMAVAHSLLSQGRWENVGLGALVEKQLAPYATGSNVMIKGEDITLGAAEVQAVAMVLHELVTNAAKYGSLSVPDGRVCITWDRVNLDAGAKLLFEWRELGGPPVQPEISSSYGTSLIRNLIPHELGGRVDLAYTPGGASCEIEIPLT
jgi:PAS domain S-box-containing protein